LALHRGIAGKSLRSRHPEYSQVDLGTPIRLFRGDTNITGTEEFQTASSAYSIDSGDYGLIEVPILLKNPVDDFSEFQEMLDTPPGV